MYLVAVKEPGQPNRYMSDDFYLRDEAKECRLLSRDEAMACKTRLLEQDKASGDKLTARLVRVAA